MTRFCPIVFSSAVELSPGAWRRANDALDLPETARRLTLPFGDPEQPRLAPTRALAVHEAIPFLISLTGQQVRPSVQAWIIAAHLAISEDTVKAHMKNVLSKLSANDRTHAVTIALKRGIIEL